MVPLEDDLVSQRSDKDSIAVDVAPSSFVDTKPVVVVAAAAVDFVPVVVSAVVLRLMTESVVVVAAAAASDWFDLEAYHILDANQACKEALVVVDVVD